VFTRRPTVPAVVSVMDNSYLVEVSPPQPSTTLSDFDAPIALRKDKRYCTDHPIFNFVSYDCFNLSFRKFVMSLSSVSILRSYKETLLVPA